MEYAWTPSKEIAGVRKGSSPMTQEELVKESQPL